jgi:hypothetical protein
VQQRDAPSFAQKYSERFGPACSSAVQQATGLENRNRTLRFSKPFSPISPNLDRQRLTCVRQRSRIDSGQDANDALIGRRRICEGDYPSEGKRALLHRISAFVRRFGICHKAA